MSNRLSVLIHQLGKRLFNQIVPRLPTIWRIRLIYLRRQHRWPNLSRPASFSEKIQWRKLYDRRKRLILFSDKLRVRRYVEHQLGPEVLLKLHWVSGDANRFDKNQLPDQFVLKVNHASNWGVQVVRDKSRFENTALRALLKDWFSQRFGWLIGEWAYLYVKPKAYAEQLLQDASGQLPNDYKFYIFHGKTQVVQVDQERGTDAYSISFYDANWQYLDARWDVPNAEPIAAPKNFELMRRYAERLAAEMDFIRVDFYNLDGQIFFGEMAVYPGSGFDRFESKEMDQYLGSLWQLNPNEPLRSTRSFGKRAAKIRAAAASGDTQARMDSLPPAAI